MGFQVNDAFHHVVKETLSNPKMTTTTTLSKQSDDKQKPKKAFGQSFLERKESFINALRTKDKNQQSTALYRFSECNQPLNLSPPGPKFGRIIKLHQTVKSPKEKCC